MRRVIITKDGILLVDDDNVKWSYVLGTWDCEEIGFLVKRWIEDGKEPTPVSMGYAHNPIEDTR